MLHSTGYDTISLSHSECLHGRRQRGLSVDEDVPFLSDPIVFALWGLADVPRGAPTTQEGGGAGVPHTVTAHRHEERSKCTRTSTLFTTQ